ncbi:PWWP domain-containing protein 2A-like isoform X2 [Physella acuta]|uniref:PWWP domain-containing protein 2A-like isoform X2 n=1 Tax=Physella acuta TaxID=109671 RepID=UPI0027DBEE02|nr:PWWP domain-containing protein 2A-like isoform X2 [Physella acuta]XP_059142554.1 PWWP domain-containing protein 2A-like isoform X2 [Physella acuta]
MANPNIGTEILTKGVCLTVLVEYSFENIIAVFLMHNGKEYRGVLLECDQGFFPHGIPFSNKVLPEKQTTSRNCSRSHSEVKHESENKPPTGADYKDMKVEQSASVSRFSYNTNPFLFNPRPISEITTVEMQTFSNRRKTVRDIRLRPRQTLCSKCKSAIHDTKNHSTTHSNSQQKSANCNLTSVSKSPLKMGLGVDPQASSSLTIGLRKRKSTFQTPLVVLEDIQHKCSKHTHETSSRAATRNCTSPCLATRRGVTRSNSSNKLSDIADKKSFSVKTRYNRSSSSGSCNSSTNVAGNDWLQIIDNPEGKKSSNTSKNVKKEKEALTASFHPKPSPAIKITIGDGAILKIPPRLPDEDIFFDTGHLPVPKIKILDISVPTDNQSHKKAKKAAKKAKERDKSKSSIIKDDLNVEIKTDHFVPYKSQKKHKKKHKHKHESSIQLPVEDEEDLVKRTDGENKIEDLSMKIHADNSFEESNAEWDKKMSGLDEENHENTVPVQDSVSMHRPRLVYTWKQNQGLSRVASSPKQSTPSVSPKYIVKTSPSIMPIGSSPHRRKNASPARVVSASPNWHFTTSPNRMLKDYPLRSKSSSTFSSGLSSESVPVAEYPLVQTSEESQSHSSGLDSHLSDFSDDSGEDRMPDDFFPGTNSPPPEEEDKGIIKPLMMKIQTQNVTGCVLEEEFQR